MPRLVVLVVLLCCAATLPRAVLCAVRAEVDADGLVLEVEDDEGQGDGQGQEQDHLHQDHQDEDPLQEQCRECDDCINLCVQDKRFGDKPPCTLDTFNDLNLACHNDASCREVEELVQTGAMHDLAGSVGFLRALGDAPLHALHLWLAMSACYDGAEFAECTLQQVRCYADDLPDGCAALHQCRVDRAAKCVADFLEPCSVACEDEVVACEERAGNNTLVANEACDTGLQQCLEECNQGDMAECLTNSQHACAQEAGDEDLAEFYEAVLGVCEKANERVVQDNAFTIACEDGCEARGLCAYPCLQ